MSTTRRIKVAVILPSRGLVFSKTVEELLTELKGIDYQIFWSHGNPIPDCFEIPTKEALKGDFSHLLVIEEDMILPKGCIKKMLDLDKPVVAYDYPVTDQVSRTVLYETDNTAYFTGVGIFLIEMDIVRRMPFPIWRSDIAWDMKNKNGYIKFTIKKRVGDYGQQDIAIGLRLYINRIPIYVMPKATGQRKLVKKGADKTNQGSHQIKEIFAVGPKYFPPKKEDDFIVVKDKNGELFNLFHTSAEKLLEKGTVERITIGKAEFYNLDLLGDWIWLQ
jgi:hypothetical protein